MTTPPQLGDRAFGLMFAAVFAVIAGVGLFVYGVVLTWVITASAVFLVLALALPGVLLPLNRLWAGLGVRLGHVSNFVLLGLFFYLFVVPTGLIMRLFTDPMQRKIDPAAQSYWSTVDRKSDAETYRDLF